MLGLLLSPGRITLEHGRPGAGRRPDPDLRGPAGLGASSARSVSRCRGASWRSSRGPGCAARCPIVLATIPLAEDVDGRRSALRHRLRDRRRLHAADRPDAAAASPGGCGWPTRPSRAASSVEAAPLERVAADLLQVTISPASRMHGVEVGELRLPPGASVSMVIRDGADPRARAAYGPAPRRRPARGHAPAGCARRPRSGCARSRPAAGWPSGWARTRTSRLRRLSR